MKGMYSVLNFLNCPPIYLDKIQELTYCHKGELTILTTFIPCGTILQCTYSKTGLILAISSFQGQGSSKTAEIGTHLS